MNRLRGLKIFHSLTSDSDETKAIFFTNLTESSSYMYVCVYINRIMWTAENTSAHDRCESHPEPQTEGTLLTFDLWCRSALCCSTSSLIKSRWPFPADTRTAVLPSWEHEIDICTVSPCLYVTNYTFHSTSVSVDQTPQWFLLHCSIGIFRACDFRCCWWTLDYTHIVHFIQWGSELIVEHLYYISMATVSCSQQGSVAPLCKEEETYSTDSCLCMCIALLACCVCSYVYVRCEVCLSWVSLEQRRGRLAC